VSSVDLSGSLLAGRYRLRARIGEGGMGAVYEAFDEQSQLVVAVKVMTGDLEGSALARFEQEARAAARLGHPNVVRVLDWRSGVEGSSEPPFLVMERLVGESLSARLAREWTLTPAAAARVAIGVLEALEAAHGAGVLHRDIKPANIFLLGSGSGGEAGRSAEAGGDHETIKVVDFGIAKVLDDPASPATTAGAFLGTLGYTPPERLLGHRGDARADLYAVGVTLHEMLSGSRPHAALKGPDLVAAILTTEPPSLASQAGLPASLAAIVDRAIARIADRRFQTAREMIDALTAFRDAPVFGQVTMVDASDRDGERAAARRKRRRRSMVTFTLITGATVLVGGAGLAAVYVGSRPRPTAEAALPGEASTTDESARRPVSGPPVSPDGAGPAPVLVAEVAAPESASQDASPGDASATGRASGRPTLRDWEGKPAPHGVDEHNRAIHCFCQVGTPGGPVHLCPASSTRDPPYCRCTLDRRPLCQVSYNGACPHGNDWQMFRGTPGHSCVGYSYATSEVGRLDDCIFCASASPDYPGPNGSPCRGFDVNAPAKVQLVGKTICH